MHMFTEKACRTDYAEPWTNGWNIRTSTRSKTYPRNPSKAKWICGKLQRCLWGYFVNSTGQIYSYVSIWGDGVDGGIGGVTGLCTCKKKVVGVYIFWPLFPSPSILNTLVIFASFDLYMMITNQITIIFSFVISTEFCIWWGIFNCKIAIKHKWNW